MRIQSAVVLLLMILLFAFPACAEFALPADLTEIEAQAFINNTGITGTVDIPAGVSVIGAEAFRSCTGITGLELPEGIVAIDEYAFAECSGLEGRLLIPSAVQVADTAFDGAAKLAVIRYETTEAGTAKIVKAHVGAEYVDFAISAEIDGLPVTEIGAEAFRGCAALTEVVLPESVTVIGENAFRGCEGLAALKLPEGVEIIGEYAFAECSGLEGQLLIPSAVQVADTAFDGAAKLAMIRYDTTEAGAAKIVRAHVGAEYVDFAIPAEIDGLPVTEIGAEAFKDCTGLTGVVIPDSVTKIGAEAFAGCVNLSGNLTLRYYTEKDDSSFTGCDRLMVRQETDPVCFGYKIESGSVTITSFNESYGITDVVVPKKIGQMPVTTIGEKAFYACNSLSSVSLPDSVTFIDVGAFFWCEYVTSIELPDSVTSIGDSAFAYCYDLSDIDIPNSVTSIGRSAFENCDSLTSIIIPGDVTCIGMMAFAFCDNLTSVTFAEGITRIDSRWMFNQCFLATVSIPDSVTHIAEGTFDGTWIAQVNAESLDGWLGITFEGYGSHPAMEGEVLIDGVSLTHIKLPDGMTKINDYMLCGFKKLVDISLPDGLTSIGNYAFYGCESLQAITIPKGVSIIGEYAFRFCNSLSSVDMPESVMNIGTAAFEYCSGLKSMAIPYGVTSIAPSTFYGCTGMTNISIPKSVTQIGGWAFQSCFGLTSITIPDSVTSIGNSAFFCCRNLTTITLPDSVTSLGGNVFESCYGLTSIVLSNGLTSIPTGAFYNCSGLTSIVIPDGVTSIERAAFSGCSGLISIQIPQSVTFIGGRSFEYCCSLISLTIPDGVTVIDDSTFRDCSSLWSITLSDNLSRINSYAFSGCTSLTEYRYSLHSITAKTMRSISNPSFYDSTWQCKFRYASSTSDNLLLIAYNHSSPIPALPDGIVTIADNAFSRTGITSITIPDSVTSIGNNAFSGCTSLSSWLHLPDTVSVASNAFQNTNVVLYRYNVNSKNEATLTVVTNCGSSPISSANVPSYVRGYPVTAIGNEAFSGRTSLVIVSLPDTLKTIGDKAFYGCFQIIDAPIPSGVTSIGAYAFYGCTNLPGSLLPPGLTSLGEYAFYSCYELSSLTIPSTLAAIPDYAFAGCKGLTSISFPQSNLKIGHCAFADCTGLTGRYVLYGISTFASDAFSGCSSQLKVISELQQAAYEYVLERMRGAYEPEFLMGNIYNDSQSAFHHVVFGAIDALNLNLDNLWRDDNKYSYLFIAAIKANSSSMEMNLITEKKEEQLEDLETVIDVWTDAPTQEATFAVVGKLCGNQLGATLSSEAVSKLYEAFNRSGGGFGGAKQILADNGITGQISDTMANSFVAMADLYDITSAARGAGYLAEGCKGVVELYNQLSFLEALDETKLKETARVYKASDDPIVRQVGEKLDRLANSTREERIRMIKDHYLDEFYLPMMVDVLIDVMVEEVLYYAGNALTATIQITNSLINAFTGLDQVPTLVNNIRFAADAATSVYGVLQSDLAAFDADPNDATFRQAYWTFLVYGDNAALSQSAFVELEQHLDDQILVNIGNDMREVVEFAEKQKGEMADMLERTKAFYEVYSEGDVDGLVELLRQQGYLK